MKTHAVLSRSSVVVLVLALFSGVTGCDDTTGTSSGNDADAVHPGDAGTSDRGEVEAETGAELPQDVPQDGPEDGKPELDGVADGDIDVTPLKDAAEEVNLELPPSDVAPPLDVADEPPSDTGPPEDVSLELPVDTAPPQDVAAEIPQDVVAELPQDTGPEVPQDTAPELPQDVMPEVDAGPAPSCPPAPSSMPVEAAAALDLANGYRAGMGIPCATLNEAINTAAELHCDYYAANSGPCTANAHKEVPGCELYVAANFWERMSMAGYGGNAVFENMAFSNDGASATQQWIDSVWHRTPVLSPWVRHFGYGGAQGCDTMDFGRGPSTPNDVVAVYPYDGQDGVPTSFNGLYEGPTPPAPPTGWPSGYVVHIYAKGATLTSHTIEVEGSGTPLPHVWITPAESSLLNDEHVMYPHTPLASQTTYRVSVSGTYTGGDLDLSWTFTTK